jgi:uncharacterized repeat protein (TIGR03803 family)
LTEIDGMLHGTTVSGGLPYYGTIYSINPRTRSEAVVYNFKGGSDGESPAGGLLAYKGVLYGTTYTTVFSFDPRSDVETMLHTFGGAADGSSPAGSPINMNGTLYGATVHGAGTGCNRIGCGTVYSIDPQSGAGKLIYAFQDNGSDGTSPYAGVVAFKGALYGTTELGGTNEAGTIFRITP